MTSTPFCLDCPDHEACQQSYPCEMVKRIDADYGRGLGEAITRQHRKTLRKIRERFATAKTDAELLGLVREFMGDTSNV